MKINLIRGITPFILFSLLAGCSSETPDNNEHQQVPQIEDTTEVVTNTEQPEEINVTKEQAIEQAKSTIIHSLQAVEDEDLDTYLQTIQVPDMEGAENHVKALFENYDLDYDIVSDIVVDMVSEDYSKVNLIVRQRTVQLTDREDFLDTELTATHTLELLDGVYKITSTDIDKSSITYLNQ